MNPIIEKLHTLQHLLQTTPTPTLVQQQDIVRLRADVPAPFLAHFDRMLQTGRKGVAEVRHGTCAGCHLRLPAALTHRAKQDDEDVQLCENCGAYLYFLPEEPATETAAPRRRARKVIATPA